MPATTPPASVPPNPFDAGSGLQAVLWDMDGTIVDTEPYWIAAETKLVHAHGGTWTEEDALRLVGQALPNSARMLQEAGVDLPIRDIIDTLTGSVVDEVTKNVPWRPGARELLEDLARHGVPCALVTMSEGPLAGLVANALPEGTFRFLVTGDMVSKGKPDPEPYLHALRTMAGIVPGLDTLRTVALEDSVPGVASAAASGARTIAVPHITALPDSGDWTVFPSLAGVSARDLDDFVRAPRDVPAGQGAGGAP